MRHILALSLSLLGSACALDEPKGDVIDEPTSEAGIALARALEGEWMSQGVQQGHCPEGLGDSPFRGRAEWTRDVDLITILPQDVAVPELTVQARGDQSLARQLSIRVEGCLFLGEVSVGITELQSEWLLGDYHANFQHDGSSACQSLQLALDLPSMCEVSADWQAVRVQ